MVGQVSRQQLRIYCTSTRDDRPDQLLWCDSTSTRLRNWRRNRLQMDSALEASQPHSPWPLKEHIHTYNYHIITFEGQHKCIHVHTYSTFVYSYIKHLNLPKTQTKHTYINKHTYIHTYITWSNISYSQTRCEQQGMEWQWALQRWTRVCYPPARMTWRRTRVRTETATKMKQFGF